MEGEGGARSGGGQREGWVSNFGSPTLEVQLWKSTLDFALQALLAAELIGLATSTSWGGSLKSRCLHF